MSFLLLASQFTFTLTLVLQPAAGFVITRRHHQHHGLAFVSQSSSGTSRQQQQGITLITSTTTTQQLYAKPKKQQIVPLDDVDANGITSMPANLKRKVHAKRPALGHVVPRHLKNPKSKSNVDNLNNGNSSNNMVGGSSNPYLRPQGKARDAGLNNPSLLKILGGSAKGRRLDSPQVYLRPMMGKVKEAVFSTFFSMGLYNNYSPGSSSATTTSTKIRHLDIFSGSGSVGLESLSRGATHCTFVDFSDDCCAAATRNMEWCFGGQSATSTSSTSSSSTSDAPKTSQIVCADYLQALRDPASVGIDPLVPFQIVTLCPPYEEVVYAELLEAVANSPLITDDTVVLVEYPVELQTLPHVIQRRRGTSNSIDDPEPDQVGGALIGIRNRKYGRTVIAMYVCNPTGKLQGAESRPEEFV